MVPVRPSSMSARPVFHLDALTNDQNLDLSVEEGEVVIIKGESGSGWVAAVDYPALHSLKS